MHLSLALRADLRIHTLKVNVHHLSVVFGREVIIEVIGKVFSFFLPIQTELVLFDEAAHPVEMHVKILVVLPAHVVSEDAVGGCAVGIDWGGRLRVAHLDAGRSDGNSLLSIEGNRYSF